MQIDSTARLIDITYAGAMGAVTRTETATTIFCGIGSVDRREYFAAYNSGLKPDFRVTTDPVNYSGQRVIDLDTDVGTIRCDIYRTYRKSADVLELWLTRKNPEAEQMFTLWSSGKVVKLLGAYLTGSDSQERTETGKVSTDTVTLILPQTLQAFSAGNPVEYCRPKAYATKTTSTQASYFTIDSSAFFAVGDIAATGKYQEINAAYDDVYRVQAVSWKNGGKPDSEYLEVIGK